MSLLEQIQALSCSVEEQHAFLQRVKPVVRVEDFQRIEALQRLLLQTREALEQNQQSTAKLRRVLFGPKTEKTSKVCPPAPAPPAPNKMKRQGHGRRGAGRYTGARRIPVCHPTLKAGQRCEKCRRGKLRLQKRHGVAMQLRGSPPVTATVWELEKLRCDGCGALFTAPPPLEAGQEKFDASVGTMVGLLRFGCGLPHYRLARLQESLGVPLPESTQWEVMLPVAQAAEPAFQELIRQAAQAAVLYVDDTKMRVRELRKKGEGGIDPKRKGTFTTAVVGELSGKTAVTFFTGWKHAGENLSEVLRHRAAGLEPPIQMCDALSRNFTREFRTVLANCLVHGRREFLDVRESFPTECRHVLEQLGEIYRIDAEAKEGGLSPTQRLVHHQTYSEPVVAELQRWMADLLEQKRTEPNSGLGQAIRYMQNHWEPLTLFLRVSGAPLDNNVAERTLKMAILHRKNSMGYKTVLGAKVGDLFMSLIHTCRRNGANPFEYLLALARNPEAVAAQPSAWLPWNYPHPATA